MSLRNKKNIKFKKFENIIENILYLRYYRV